MGMGWPQQLDVRLDGKLLKRFTVGGTAPGTPAAASYAGDGEPGFAGAPEWETYMQLTGDAGLEVRVPVSAGPRVVGVSFVRELWEPEGLPQPQQRGTGPDQRPDLHGLRRGGIGPGRRTVPRRRYGRRPRRAGARSSSATRTPPHGARPARRPTPAPRRSCRGWRDWPTGGPSRQATCRRCSEFFASGRREGGSFDAGIQFALERMLVDPDFLLRVQQDPPHASGAPRPAARRLTDIELASRLSFFLWSSIPDERLLDLAERGELSKPAMLAQQVRRMLADPRAASAFVDDFAAQWLNLRRVGEVVVHPDVYPDFDDNLLDAFTRRPKLFIADTLRDDRSVSDLLRADYTFVNERLARHYGIPGIYGTRFRRVTLPNPDQRGGLLAHGALLATTSYPDRTSPVLRGKWLLDNIFGVYVPPPPANVDTTLPEIGPARCRRPFVSGWRNIGPTRSAPVATR